MCGALYVSVTLVSYCVEIGKDSDQTTLKSWTS